MERDGARRRRNGGDEDREANRGAHLRFLLLLRPPGAADARTFRSAPEARQKGRQARPKIGRWRTRGTSEVEDGSSGLEFLLLGPLEVRRDGSPLDLGPPKQRAVLALLLLRANHVVSTTRLIDELWGEAPPETARAALQVYVAGLRKALGDGQATLGTKTPGYILEVAPGALDLDRFERLRDEARACDDPAHRSALLRDALALWRDTPLGEFDGEPFAAIAAEQLEERRLAALEERIDTDLVLGRHAGLVAELDALVVQHPYRERFRGQLMLALYRSGRQADALAAYRDAREAFASGLGLEPGPELKALERAVLEQDPSLGVPRAEPAPTPPSPTARVKRRPWIVAPIALMGAVLVAVVAFFVFEGDDAPRVVVPPNSVAVIDPATNDVVQAIQVGIRPGPITAGGGEVWVGNRDDHNLTRIDMRTRRPAGTLSLDGRTPTGLAFDRGTVWVAHGLLGSVSLVDAQLGDVVRVTPVTREGGLLFRGERRGGRRSDLGGVRRRDVGPTRAYDGEGRGQDLDGRFASRGDGRLRLRVGCEHRPVDRPALQPALAGGGRLGQRR